MKRVFRRGELRVAVLQVLAALEPEPDVTHAGTSPPSPNGHDAGANGYVIMHRLQDRIGGTWRASPGAVYPALLSLEDAGLVTGHDRDGGRAYQITDAGRRATAEHGELLTDVARRAAGGDHQPTLGQVLDGFAAQVPDRQRPLEPEQEARVRSVLRAAHDQIRSVVRPPEPSHQGGHP